MPVSNPAVIPALQVRGLLALTSYNPSADVLFAVTNVFTDVDATNVKVTFVAPASGKVIVKQSVISFSNASTSIYLNLRDASGDIPGTGQMVTANTPMMGRVTSYHPITGLVPGVNPSIIKGTPI